MKKQGHEHPTLDVVGTAGAKFAGEREIFRDDKKSEEQLNGKKQITNHSRSKSI